MDHKGRHKRLRVLVSGLNKERKNQAKKIDILCNDIIVGQGEFIRRLNVISFAANFYQAIVGTTDLNKLLYIAGKLIKDEIVAANVAFFLRQEENFKLHMFESEQPISFEKERLENCFTAELVDNICKSNKLCDLNDMFAMGLQGNLTELNRISAFTIPLGQLGPPLGFILIYRSLENGLTVEHLKAAAAIAPGLSQGIQSCQVLSHFTCQ